MVKGLAFAEKINRLRRLSVLCDVICILFANGHEKGNYKSVLQLIKHP